MLRDDRVAAATLTGSAPAGQSVASIAGDALKKTVLELGGSDPFIVMPSADLEKAAEVAVTARNQNNGQSCIAAKRFFVHRDVAEEFTRLFAEKIGALTVGDPMAEDTQIGPLATESGREDVEKYVQDAVAKGATVLVGGQAGRPARLVLRADAAHRHHAGDGPLLRGGLRPGRRAVHRRLASTRRSRSRNSHPYGLGRNLWSEDEGERAQFVRDVASGMAFVNGMVTSYPELPFGGVKQSGYGRELTELGMREFMNAKTVWIGPPSSEQGGGHTAGSAVGVTAARGCWSIGPRAARPDSAACRDQCRRACQSAGHPAARAGRRLVDGVVLRRGERRPGHLLLGGEVPEPVLAGFEAAHDRVAGGPGVSPRVLVGRGVAAADVPALRAAAEVEPPPAGRLALDAPGARRRHRGVDGLAAHPRPPQLKGHTSWNPGSTVRTAPTPRKPPGSSRPRTPSRTRGASATSWTPAGRRRSARGRSTTGGRRRPRSRPARAWTAGSPGSCPTAPTDDGDGLGDSSDTDGELLDDEVGDARAGRLVDSDDGGNEDTDDELWARDEGIDGAAASAEEAAVHVVRDRDL